jgi:hypothetical protein
MSCLAVDAYPVFYSLALTIPNVVSGSNQPVETSKGLFVNGMLNRVDSLSQAATEYLAIHYIAGGVAKKK